MEMMHLKTDLSKRVMRLYVIIGFIICGNLLGAQNSLSLDYFKRINACAADQGFNSFSRQGNEVVKKLVVQR